MQHFVLDVKPFLEYFRFSMTFVQKVWRQCKYMFFGWESRVKLHPRNENYNFLVVALNFVNRWKQNTSLLPPIFALSDSGYIKLLNEKKNMLKYQMAEWNKQTNRMHDWQWKTKKMKNQKATTLSQLTICFCSCR